MTFYKKKGLWIFFGVSILSLIFLYETMPWTRNLVLVEKDENRNVILPFYEKGQNNRIYEIKGEIYRGLLWQKTVKANIDNCLLEVVINEKEVFKENKCKPESVTLNFDHFLNFGQNTIDIKFKNETGDTAFYFSGSLKDPIFATISIFLLIGLSGGFFYLIRNFGFSRILTLVFVLGFLLRFFYSGQTGLFVRDHDNGSEGHLGYIQYIARNFLLPNANQGWEFYQPPFYYMVAAFIYRVTETFGLYNTIEIQRVFEIFLSMGFIICGWLIFREFLSNKFHFLLASILLAVWPSAVMHSIRIGNDGMFYLLFMMSFYFLIKWFKGTKDKDFYFLFLSALMAHLAILTKSNGLVMFFVFFVAFLFLFLTKNKKFKFGEGIFVLILIISSLGVVVSRSPFLVGNAKDLNNNLKIKNNLENYLFFDIHYLLEPFAYPFNDKGGRNFLPVYLFKTSLTGEWNLKGFEVQNIIIFLYFILMNLVLISTIGIFSWRKKEFGKNLLLISLFVFLLLAIGFFRYKMPFACSQDFRYILPILVPFIIFVFQGIEKFKEKRWILLEYFGYLNVGLFLILSVLLILLIK